MRLTCTASSELTIVSPSCGQALTSIGAEPVAMTTSAARTVSLWPSRFFTRISVGLVKEASP